MQNWIRYFIASIKESPSLITLLIDLVSGKPVFIVTFSSLGDLMMVNGVLQEFYSQRGKKATVIMRNDTLTKGLDFIGHIINKPFTYEVAKKLSSKFSSIKVLNYGKLDEDKESHFMQRIANRIPLQLPNKFSARVNDAAPLPKELQLPSQFIVIQSTAKTTWTENKNWIKGRMQELSKELKSLMPVVQLGLPSDELLDVDIQLAGKLSFKQSLAVLQKSSLLVGLEGALMHASASLEVPSVIIFGGYIHPHQTGYSTVTPLYSKVDCAPCLLQTPCPYQMKCMDSISVDQVLETVKKELSHSLTSEKA